MTETPVAKIKESLSEQAIELQMNDPDLSLEASISSSLDQANTSKDEGLGESQPKTWPYKFIPLTMSQNMRTHLVSKESAALMKEVPYKKLKQMTECFYSNAFQDDTLDKFLRSHTDPHGARFAKWIHQKLSGSNLWDKERKKRDKTPVTVAGGRQTVVNDRSSAHVAAWYSPKRPKEEVGRHFKLDECRVWMRLHFWALREVGLIESSPSFADFYVRFIGHFVSVYESQAPMFARDSLRWSENPDNIEKYLKNGRKMKDVLGLSLGQAIAQIPESESNDMVWPYNQTETYSRDEGW